MHQSDLTGYVGRIPIQRLLHSSHGSQLQQRSDARSFGLVSGLLAQVTGGNPRTTGVYYDDSYAHDLFEPGTTDCAGAKPGGAVSFTEELDKDITKIDGGQGLTNLPDGVLQMTGTPTEVIDTAKLPVDPMSCKPLMPGEYLK